MKQQQATITIDDVDLILTGVHNKVGEDGTKVIG